MKVLLFPSDNHFANTCRALVPTERMELLIGTGDSLPLETDNDLAGVIMDADSPRTFGQWEQLLQEIEQLPCLFVSRDASQRERIAKALPRATCLDSQDLSSELMERLFWEWSGRAHHHPSSPAGPSQRSSRTDTTMADMRQMAGSSNPPNSLSLAPSPVPSILRQGLESLFGLVETISATQRWLESWQVSRDGVDCKIPAGLLQKNYQQLFCQVRDLCDVSQLSDDRAALSRDCVSAYAWLIDVLSEAGLSIGTLQAFADHLSTQIDHQVVSLRIDSERTCAAIRSTIRSLLQNASHLSIETRLTARHLELSIETSDELNGEEFAELARGWSQASWPNWNSTDPFTWNLGLARERLLCQGGDLFPRHSDEQKLALVMRLPLDQPETFVAGFRDHLSRRLHEPAAPIGAFLVQSDGASNGLDDLTDSLLRQQLGSCTLVIRRGTHTWSILAPVGPDESSDFVEWLQQTWRDAREERLRLYGEAGMEDAGIPQIFAISVIGHLSLRDSEAAWCELYRAAASAIGPFGNEPPIVVISRGTTTKVDHLAQRLVGSGCQVTQVHEQTPCPEEWFDRAPQILDLRADDVGAWQHLDELVRSGSLGRQVILLTESLQRQNDRLSELGRLFQTEAEESSPLMRDSHLAYFS